MSKLALLSVLLAWPLWPQSNATITGSVKDQTGASIPNAKVVVRAVETGVLNTTKTNSEGYFTVPSLPPFQYVTSAEAAGFKTAETQPMKLDTASTLRVDLVLYLGANVQAVDVAGIAPAIESESSTVGTTVHGKEIEFLPLQGRNTLELALTVAGVGGEVGIEEGGISDGVTATGAGLAIGGGRPSNSAILADGIGSTSVAIGRATATFSPDTIQEFKVITSTFSAQYGVTGGGIVSMISKSGTDQFRGSASWFTRNPLLVARNFGDTVSPTLRRNEGSLTVGGPVVLPKIYNGKQRTFFFFSFEPKRWIDAQPQLFKVPTAAERAGDFRDSWVAPGQTNPLLYQQISCAPSEASCSQFNRINVPTTTSTYSLFSANDPDPTKRGHVIPASYLSPAIQNYLQKYLPLPNMPFDSNGNNYVGARGVVGADNRWNLKVDHNFSAANRLSARYTDIPNEADKYRFQKGNYLAFSNPSEYNKTKQATVSDSHTFSPHVVNEFRGGVTLSNYSRFPSGDAATVDYTKDLFGLPSVTGWGIPYLRTGYIDLGLNTGNGLGYYLENQYQAADDVTVISGRHTLTMGTDWRIQQLNSKSDGLPAACCGTYLFTTAATASGNNNTPGGTGGNTFASFLLGIPNSATLRPTYIPYYYRWHVGSAYFQDDFKVRSNVTLNLGVRWEYNSPRAEKYDRQATVDLDHPVPLLDAKGRLLGNTVNLLYSGHGRSRYLEPAHKADFEPRFGFAWTPARLWNRQITVRGGYGISHAPNTGRERDPIPDFGSGSGSWNYNRWTGTGPEPTSQAVDPSHLIAIGRNAPVVAADPTVYGIPTNGILCAGCTPKDSRVPGTLISFSNTNSTPYIQTWSLNTQFELSSNLILSLGYMGQKGTHLFSGEINVNKPNLQQFQNLLNQGIDPTETIPDPYGRVDSSGNLLTIALQDLLRPYPTLANIFVAGLTNSNSIYNSGSLSIERRFSRGLGFRFNYTWAKSIDTSSDASLNSNRIYSWGFDRVQDPTDLAANRSVSLFDQRHRFNLTFNGDLPFGKGRRFLQDGFKPLRYLAGGWAVSGIASLYSGIPFEPFLGTTDANGLPGVAGSGNLEVVRPDLVPGVPIVNPRWNKSVANDVPYFNPQAFARPAFGMLGNAARTLDFARDPWQRSLNTSLIREFRPFGDGKRYFQLRGDFFNVLNHVNFRPNSDSSLYLFTGSVPVSRAGLSLAGPLPYFPDQNASYPAGSKNSVLANYYNSNFGKCPQGSNSAGRIIQLALKFYW